MNEKDLVSIVLAVTVLGSARPCLKAAPISELVVFGASLEDTGNLHDKYPNYAPSPPYYDGRFSNGPVWVERLAGLLELPQPITDRRGGKNYAWAGATTGSTANPLGIAGTNRQVRAYLSSNTPTSDELFIISAGGNDIRFGQTDMSRPVKYIADQVSQLASSGAQYFLVANVWNNALSARRVSEFNVLLEEKLSELQATNETLWIREIDRFELLESVRADPASFGFSDASSAACRDCGRGVEKSNPTHIVPNPDEFFFWDDVHPTGEGHQLLANQAFELVQAIPGAERPRLMAGDADQDMDFDQQDLVRVQIAAKYLTGEPATWGDGDWNGAPGGRQGSPLIGDGLFNQLDIIAALNAGKYLAGPYNALPGPVGTGGGNATLVYDAGTGELAVEVPGTELSSLNIQSAASVFTGDPAENLGGDFDNDSEDDIFKATFGGSFGSLSFGNVAQAGLSEEFVINDLTADGSLAGGGSVGAVDLRYIPEPSSVVLLGLGLLGALVMRRRRS